jgi:hypothetical protein
MTTSRGARHRSASQSSFTAVTPARSVTTSFSGHIPPDDIIRLLREKPTVKGLSVPGMPVESPGMEVGDRKDPYEVVAFRTDGSSYTFAKY